MELLWAATAPQSVAEIQDKLTAERPLAYTTVMTVLDRLAKKQLARRERVDRAWQYTAAIAQSDLLCQELAELLAEVPSDARLDALRQLGEKLSADERRAIAGD